MIAIRKQWVYITKDDWCNMQNEYIKEKEKSGSLVPYMTSNKKRITGTYKFIPGSSGLRPLYMTKYIKFCLTFLQCCSLILQININNKVFCACVCVCVCARVCVCVYVCVCVCIYIYIFAILGMILK